MPVRFPCLLELFLQEFFFNLTPPASKVTMLPQIRRLVSPSREQLPDGEPEALTRASPVSNLCNYGDGPQDLNRKLLCRVPEIPHLLYHASDPVRSRIALGTRLNRKQVLGCRLLQSSIQV